MRALALAMFLGACAAQVEMPTVPPEQWRDTGQPIGSTTRGGPSDMAGPWVVSAGYPGGPVPVGGTVVLDLDAGGTGVWSFSGAPAAADFPLPVRLVAPGRYRGTLAPGQEVELWVLWVDDDFRTAVVGTPDGSFGWVMDRPGQASGDRARAAREILDFSGYDLGALL